MSRRISTRGGGGFCDEVKFRDRYWGYMVLVGVMGIADRIGSVRTPRLADVKLG